MAQTITQIGRNGATASDLRDIGPPFVPRRPICVMEGHDSAIASDLRDGEGPVSATVSDLRDGEGPERKMAVRELSEESLAAVLRRRLSAKVSRSPISSLESEGKGRDTRLSSGQSREKTLCRIGGLFESLGGLSARIPKRHRARDGRFAHVPAPHHSRYEQTMLLWVESKGIETFERPQDRWRARTTHASHAGQARTTRARGRARREQHGRV